MRLRRHDRLSSCSNRNPSDLRSTGFAPQKHSLQKHSPQKHSLQKHSLQKHSLQKSCHPMRTTGLHGTCFLTSKCMTMRHGSPKLGEPAPRLEPPATPLANFSENLYERSYHASLAATGICRSTTRICRAATRVGRAATRVGRAATRVGSAATRVGSAATRVGRAATRICRDRSGSSLHRARTAWPLATSSGGPRPKARPAADRGARSHAYR